MGPKEGGAKGCQVKCLPKLVAAFFGGRKRGGGEKEGSWNPIKGLCKGRAPKTLEAGG